jgi:hypothetical protein
MGCGASAPSAPGSAVQERAKGAAAKVSVGAKEAGAKATKAWACTRSLQSST